MRLRILFALAAVALLVADASACGRRAKRSSGGAQSCASCAPQSATAYAPQQSVYPAGYPQYLPAYSQPGCVGGNCPLPQAPRGFTFPAPVK